MKPIFVCWNPKSPIGNNIAKGLGAEFISRGDDTRARKGQHIINWGCGYDKEVFSTAARIGAKIINKPDAIANAVNKITTFQILERNNIPIPRWTTDAREAQQWIADGVVVYARSKVEGKQGEGLHLYNAKGRRENPTFAELTGFRLFTERFPENWEFKVHVINGKVNHVIRVDRDEDFEQNPFVRNHNEGWTFYDEHKKLAPQIQKMAVAGVAALGLDFGVCDVGVGRKPGQAVIYEINTAPGGMPEDAALYVKAFRKEFGVGK
jgi:glutathione synthase/RimK-type ligase-like ATP-grasp enzyme